MCTVPEIPFSMFIVQTSNYNRTYTTGEMIILACKKGFKKQQGDIPIRICVSGRWTQFLFKCEDNQLLLINPFLLLFNLFTLIWFARFRSFIFVCI